MLSISNDLEKALSGQFIDNLKRTIQITVKIIMPDNQPLKFDEIKFHFIHHSILIFKFPNLLLIQSGLIQLS